MVLRSRAELTVVNLTEPRIALRTKRSWARSIPLRVVLRVSSITIHPLGRSCSVECGIVMHCKYSIAIIAALTLAAPSFVYVVITPTVLSVLIVLSSTYVFGIEFVYD